MVSVQFKFNKMKKERGIFIFCPTFFYRIMYQPRHHTHTHFFLSQTVMNGCCRYTDMVNDLATVGEDPNQFNEFGEAPLCVAAYKGQGMVVVELLQRDSIIVNIKGKHGRTPLYIAAEEGHVFIVKCLLSHSSIDVNSRYLSVCSLI